MRKLLHLVYGILKAEEVYDPSKAFLDTAKRHDTYELLLHSDQILGTLLMGRHSGSREPGTRDRRTLGMVWSPTL